MVRNRQIGQFRHTKPGRPDVALRAPGLPETDEVQRGAALIEEEGEALLVAARLAGARHDVGCPAAVQVAGGERAIAVEVGDGDRANRDARFETRARAETRAAVVQVDLDLRRAARTAGAGEVAGRAGADAHGPGRFEQPRPGDDVACGW